MADDDNNDSGKKRGGLLKWIGFGLGGIMLIGAGLGGGYLLFGMQAPSPSEEIEDIIEQKMAEAEAERAAAEDALEEAAERVAKEKPLIETFVTTYFEFPGTFTTNLKNSRKFLQLGLGVSTQYDDSVMANVEAHQLALRSEILNVMSEFTEEGIQGKAGREMLAKALALGINEKLVLLEDFGGIEEVHFTSFVLQ